jgi:hypothetical protein
MSNPINASVLIIDYCWFSINVYLVRGVDFMFICFEIFLVSQSNFLQMGKFEATNLMDMPSHVRFYILKILNSGEDKA